MDGILIDNSAQAAAEAWLADFAAALDSDPLDSSRAARIAALFAAECHWRDILAFSWNLRTASGAAAIAQRMAPALTRLAPRGLGLAEGRTPPRRVVRAGIDAIASPSGPNVGGAPWSNTQLIATSADSHSRFVATPTATLSSHSVPIWL